MSIATEIAEQCTSYFRNRWPEPRVGRVVPAPESLKLANEAILLNPATVLYADLSDSTSMVDSSSWFVSAEVYKAFLYTAARLIRSEGGEITSYDGDRVMGVFMGATQCDDAVRCALKINFAVKNIVQPAFLSMYTGSGVKIRHVVGIDTSQVHAVRIGIRGGNDIVWVGRAPNYAAKLTGLDHDYPTWITEAVFKQLTVSCTHASGTSMWEPRVWTPNNNLPIFRSTYWWRFS